MVAKRSLQIFLLTFCVYGFFAGDRLFQSSSNNHFAYLAQDFLNGRLSMGVTPPHGNDWARVVTLTLADGRVLKGKFLRAQSGFQTLGGKVISVKKRDILQEDVNHYVSFPWFPAILMLPFVALFGLGFNDVLFTVILASFNPVLVYLILRRLKDLGLSNRNEKEHLFFVSLFAFGTVHFFSAVLGQVWYTAHIIGFMLSCLYVLASLNGARPFYAGLFAGLGFVTRTSLAFSFPFFLGEIFRKHNGTKAGNTFDSKSWYAFFKDGLIAAFPAAVILVITGVLNVIRFGKWTEFGHSYLNVRWSKRIEEYGLFNVHFLSRNLTVFFTSLPKFSSRYPFAQISYHGLALWFTTPYFLSVLWPKKKSELSLHSWLSILFPMALHFLYQNSGWVQFGYRFSLDYMIYLIILLAVGGRKLSLVAYLLLFWSFVVNGFGAYTFDRFWDFYWNGLL